MTEKFKSNLVSIVIISAVPVLALWQVSFFSNTMKWDILDQFLPCRYFISECWKQQVFPLWCPYINLGYPFTGDPQSGFFYPVTWLLSVLGGYTVYSIALEYVFHVVIAAAGFYLLLRNFEMGKTTSVAWGLTYSLSGLFIGNAQHLSWITAMAWIPFILLQFNRMLYQPNFSNALKFALFLYLGLTGGYPGFYVILIYFFGVCVAGRFASLLFQKRTDTLKDVSKYFIVAVVLFVVFSCGYLYSFIEAMPHIARGKPVTLAEANSVAFTPSAMISLLFPFATASKLYSLGTDISMANGYMGFMFFPFLLLGVFKTRLKPFQKWLLAFACICLLASLGKYCFVRTLLYHYLPGMNMIRHAAIFRVFALLGFMVVGANGFQWFIDSIRGSNLTLAKRLLITYSILLLLAVVFFFISTGHVNNMVAPYNSTDIFLFNQTESVYTHLLLQSTIQLVLSLLVLVVLLYRNITPAAKSICCCVIVVIDMVIAAQLNLPATVISETKPSELQSKLNEYPKGFPVPPLQPMASISHISNGTTLPIWYNMSFYRKTPSHDGFNSFYLQGADDFKTSAEAVDVMANPYIFSRDGNVNLEVRKFSPSEIKVHYSSSRSSDIILQQNFYEGWKVETDNSPSLLLMAYGNLLSCQVPEGDHTVTFTYNRPEIKFLFWLTVASFMLAVIFLLVKSNRS